LLSDSDAYMADVLYAEQAQYHALQGVDTRRQLMQQSTACCMAGYSILNRFYYDFGVHNWLWGQN